MKLQLVLKDGTEVELVEAGLSRHFVVSCENEDAFIEIWKSFTPINLAEVEIKEDDATVQMIEGMTLDGVQTVTNEDGSITGHFYCAGGTYSTNEYAEAGKLLLGEGEEATE